MTHAAAPTTIPVSLAVSGLQGLLLAPGLVGSTRGGEEDGLRVTLIALTSFHRGAPADPLAAGPEHLTRTGG
jgi:hypothetical protein